MKNNLISILITNYNKENFLKRCLDSVSKQNFKNYEIIMFDDCSDDDSLKIAEKYKKIKIIRNKKRSNTGVEDSQRRPTSRIRVASSIIPS